MNDIENMLEEPSPNKKRKATIVDDLDLDNYEGGSDDEWDDFENEIAGIPEPEPLAQSTQQTNHVKPLKPMNEPSLDDFEAFENEIAGPASITPTVAVKHTQPIAKPVTNKVKPMRQLEDEFDELDFDAPTSKPNATSNKTI